MRYHDPVNKDCQQHYCQDPPEYIPKAVICRVSFFHVAREFIFCKDTFIHGKQVKNRKFSKIDKHGVFVDKTRLQHDESRKIIYRLLI
jgi:hypothetical protein